jgi:hypothetical protein
VGGRNHPKRVAGKPRNKRPESSGTDGRIGRNTHSAIEPTIGHLKEHKRLNRNRLKGVLGDKVNALLAAAALNLHKIMRALAGMPALLARFLVWLLAALELRRLSSAPSGAH